MNRILLVGEDALSCALGQMLLKQVLPAWSLAREPVNVGGVTKLIAALPRYAEQAAFVQPVLCIADTDGQCPVDLVQSWLPDTIPDALVLRLAVSEAESWLLADREAFAEFLRISIRNVPDKPDDLADAKREVLRLARASKVRQIRQEVISPLDMNKPGSGYNVHLAAFVRERWRCRHAAERSPSLARAVRRLVALGARRG